MTSHGSELLPPPLSTEDIFSDLSTEEMGGNVCVSSDLSEDYRANGSNDQPMAPTCAEFSDYSAVAPGGAL